MLWWTNLLQVQRNHLGLVDYVWQLAATANDGPLVQGRRFTYEGHRSKVDAEVCLEVRLTDTCRKGSLLIARTALHSAQHLTQHGAAVQWQPALQRPAH
jgi:hypothetical protein